MVHNRTRQVKKGQIKKECQTAECWWRAAESIESWEPAHERERERERETGRQREGDIVCIWGRDNEALRTSRERHIPSDIVQSRPIESKLEERDSVKRHRRTLGEFLCILVGGSCPTCYTGEWPSLALSTAASEQVPQDVKVGMDRRVILSEKCVFQIRKSLFICFSYRASGCNVEMSFRRIKYFLSLCR